MTGQPEEELGIGQVGSSSWSTSGKNDFKGGINLSDPQRSHSKDWEFFFKNLPFCLPGVVKNLK